MDDLIRRADAMDFLFRHWKAAESREDTEIAEQARFYYTEISNLPKASGGWTLCKEGLPEESEPVFLFGAQISSLVMKVEPPTATMNWKTKTFAGCRKDGRWIWANDSSAANYEILAWKPIFPKEGGEDGSTIHNDKL